MKMTDEEFNRLLHGPLLCANVILSLGRLANALRAVVDASGYAGASAFREYCAACDRADDLADLDNHDQDRGQELTREIERAGGESYPGSPP